MGTTDTVAMVGQAAAAPNASFFNFDPWLAVLTWVVFGLLFVVLRKYAWGPMMKTVRDRERMMAEAVENARKTKEELEGIAQRQKEMLLATEEQARAIVEEGRKSAEEVARKVSERAQQDAEQTLKRAQEQLQREKDRAVDELRQHAVDMVIEASEKLVAESLDDEQHRRIVQRQLEAL